MHIQVLTTTGGIRVDIGVQEEDVGCITSRNDDAATPSSIGPVVINVAFGEGDEAISDADATTSVSTAVSMEVTVDECDIAIFNLNTTAVIVVMIGGGVVADVTVAESSVAIVDEDASTIRPFLLMASHGSSIGDDKSDEVNGATLNVDDAPCIFAIQHCLHGVLRTDGDVLIDDIQHKETEPGMVPVGQNKLITE